MAWNWNVIQAQAGTNLVLNPSFEKWSTGVPVSWVKNADSLTQSPTQSWRGAYGCLISQAGTGYAGIYQDIAASNGTVYTCSAYIYVQFGSAFILAYDYNSSNNPVSTVSTGTGWQRITVTKTAAGGGLRLFIAGNNVACAFWVDAVQVEAGATATTYIDGDEPGCYWNGTPHASTSTRDGQSREGGVIVPLANYFEKIIKFPGAGTPPFKNVGIPFGLIGGEIYQRTIKQARNFVIRGAINANPTTATYHNKRRTLFDLLKYDAVTPTQPVKLQYDDGKIPKLEIKAVYNGGLEISDFEGWHEFVDLGFTAHDPLFYSEQESAQVLGYSTTVANFGNIGYRDVDGTWKAMGTGANGLVNDILHAMDGSVYICGAFTSVNSVANTARVARYINGAWTPLSTGISAGTVTQMAEAPDGSIFFAQNNSTSSKIWKWNGSSFTSWDANNWITNVAIGPDGIVYAKGGFTTIDGVAANYIAKFNGSTWSAMSTGPGGTGTRVAVGPDRCVYATKYDGVDHGVMKWDGSAWTELGTGFNDDISAMCFGADGKLYVGGNFTVVNGSAIVRVAYWNGTSWYPMSSGVNGYVWVITPGHDGLIYIGGNFTTAGGNAMIDRATIWNGSSFVPLDINLQDGSANIYAFTQDKLGRLYIGGDWSGTNALSATTTAIANASTKTYPRMIFSGPGTLDQIINFATGRRIYFNSLTLQVGEVAVLTLTPGNISFISNWRRNLLSYVMNGSNLDFYLQPGTNNISTYLANGTAASSVIALWRNAYWSIDGVE